MSRLCAWGYVRVNRVCGVSKNGSLPRDFVGSLRYDAIKAVIAAAHKYVTARGDCPAERSSARFFGASLLEVRTETSHNEDPHGAGSRSPTDIHLPGQGMTQAKGDPQALRLSRADSKQSPYNRNRRVRWPAGPDRRWRPRRR
jgi:hypothetical protein